MSHHAVSLRTAYTSRLRGSLNSVVHSHRPLAGVIRDIESKEHLKVQIALPVSALGFQDCCLAQRAASNSLIEGLEERVASHLTSADLHAPRLSAMSSSAACQPWIILLQLQQISLGHHPVCMQQQQQA